MKKKFKILLIVIITVTIFVLFFSSYKIITWYLDNKSIDNQIKDISQNIKIVEVVDNNKTEVVNPPSLENNKFDPYWDYIKIPLISVDFDELLKKNDDTVGWIRVNNTNINYPVVQASNNKFYLNHSFDGKYNDAGWVFMDYRNNSNSFDRNTIIYGHSRIDRSMFGSLRNMFTTNWFNNKDNHIIRLSTPSENTLWQVFSVYTIDEESYYLTTNFSDNDDYIYWLNTMSNRSKFDFGVNINYNDKVLTLSSCYTTDGIRMVLHAKLIKKEAR